MVISFWPIYADHSTSPGNSGGIDSLRHAVEYITNPAKTRALAPPDMSFFPADPRVQHMVTSMNADDATAQYVSSYLCSADHAAQDFLLNAYLLSVKTRFATDPETGPFAYHMVQSFPPNLDISDEEVHQCGIELVKKLEKYQGIISSHVHPVIDADDHVHGRCKHNHILISAVVHADAYDPAVGGPRKFHDCSETYHQLQIFNDEIAVAHGLPIIHHCDKHRSHSRSGRTELCAGMSPEDTVRREIEKVRAASTCWSELTQQLLADGYAIKEFGDVAYTTPDGHVVCDRTLGHRYTKDFLELFWAIRDSKDSYIYPDKTVLSSLVTNHDSPLFVRVPLGPDFLQSRPYKAIPLTADVPGDASALSSYFCLHDLYEVFDESEQVVAIVTGLEICRSIEDLRDTELEFFRLRAKEEEEARIKRERAQRERERVQNINEYYNARFRDIRNGRPICCSYYDEDGRARTGLELIYVLALTLLGKEAYLWVPRGPVPQDAPNEIFFAKTNVKIQRMVDACETARREGIETPAHLDRLLEQTKSSLSRAEKALALTRDAFSAMSPVAAVIETYERTHHVATAVAAMPHGPEKAVAQARYAAMIQEYESAAQFLQARGLTDDAAITDFLLRYEQLQDDILVLEERISSARQRLDMLKSLQHDMHLAQDPLFLCPSRYLSTERDSTSEPEPLWKKIEAAQEAADQQNPFNGQKGPSLGR